MIPHCTLSGLHSNLAVIPEAAVQTRCSYKFRKTHRKTSVLESLFNKVADLQLY